MSDTLGTRPIRIAAEAFVPLLKSESLGEGFKKHLDTVRLKVDSLFSDHGNLTLAEDCFRLDRVDIDQQGLTKLKAGVVAIDVKSGRGSGQKRETISFQASQFHELVNALINCLQSVKHSVSDLSQKLKVIQHPALQATLSSLRNLTDSIKDNSMKLSALANKSADILKSYGEALKNDLLIRDSDEIKLKKDITIKRTGVVADKNKTKIISGVDWWRISSPKRLLESLNSLLSIRDQLKDQIIKLVPAAKKDIVLAALGLKAT